MKLSAIPSFDRLLQLFESHLSEYLTARSCGIALAEEAYRYSLQLPGKRVRPVLTLMAAELGTGLNSGALAAALAIELTHTYSLIHDDLPCMDDDEYRRGKLCNHKVFGEANALLVGSALSVDAFAVLAQSRELSAERKIAMISVLAEAVSLPGLIGGQIMDINPPPAQDKAPHLLEMQRRKTGALFTAALVLGGHAGDLREDAIAALSTFGQNIGLAFQIRDDVLDLGQATERSEASYAELVGRDAAQREIAILTEAGIAALNIFQPQAAEPLRQLAVFLTTRET